MTPMEGTTAATDAGLAALAWAGVLWLRRTTPSSLLRATWMAAIGTFGVAALLGAIAHGLPWSAGALKLLWQPLYLALGVAVALFVMAAVGAAWGDAAARRARPILLTAAAVFYLLTRLTGGDFLVFVIYEGVGLLIALGVHARLAMRGRDGAGWIAAGLAVSLAAGAVQAADTITLRLVWTFDHNGVYHLIQAVGLGLLLAGLRRLLAAPESRARTT
jgi:hypothetical protein